MANEFALNIESRSDLGKGASRRLRRLENKVPAILYGTDKDPVSISLQANELKKALENEAFFSHILTLNLKGDTIEAVLKDLQRHPQKGHVMHADFLRIDKSRKIHMQVPLHFINESICAGVKQEGGTITHQMAEVEVTCLASDLPEFIEVDLANTNIGDIVHLSDLTVPSGVELSALSHGTDHDLPVATVNAPRSESEEEDADTGTPTEDKPEDKPEDESDGQDKS